MAFDDAKRVFHLRPNFSGTLSNQLFHILFFKFFTLLCALISSIARDEFLIAMQQVLHLIQVMLIGGGGDGGGDGGGGDGGGMGGGDGGMGGRATRRMRRLTSSAT